MQFLEMMEELTLKQRNDVKYRGKKSTYTLEEWEALYSTIQEHKDIFRTLQGENRMWSVKRILNSTLQLDIENLVLIASGKRQTGKPGDSAALIGYVPNIATTLCVQMATDEDIQQIIQLAFTAYSVSQDKIKERIQQCRQKDYELR